MVYFIMIERGKRVVTVFIVLGLMIAAAAALVVSIANNLVDYGVQMREGILPESLEKPEYQLLDYFGDSAFYKQAFDWVVGQHPEDVSTVTHDGLTLRGLFFLHPGARYAALVLPGWTDRKEYLYAEVKLMFDAGLSVLIPDQRSQGTSEGEYSSFGYFESMDAMGWINLLKEKGFHRIVLYGRSMGAATTMITACKYPQDIACAVEDCGFTSMRDEVSSFTRTRVRWVPPFLYPLLTWISNPLIKKRAGYQMEDASPISLLPGCQVPMLFIHGEEDTFVPYAMMADLYAAHPGPKERLSVENAGHALSLAVGGQQYINTVHNFIKKYL